MGERREGEGGKADYINLWWDIFTPWSPAKGVPNASKFKFQEPEEGDPDELVYRMYAKRREDNADHYAQYSMDNVGITHAGIGHRSLKAVPIPVFTDWIFPEHMVGGYKWRSTTLQLQQQYDHCVGQLGEDHPTCQKAGWYLNNDGGVLHKELYTELKELGHYDYVHKWGVKPRRSFLPRYQNVKKNIPGAYEFYRSEEYLEKFKIDGTGEWTIGVMLAD